MRRHPRLVDFSVPSAYTLCRSKGASMTDLWERYRRPIPVLQWLVVIVLSAHALVSSHSSLTTGQTQAFVLALVGGNLLLLYGLPRIIPWTAVLAVLVVVDSLLVPVTLYATGIN